MNRYLFNDLNEDAKKVALAEVKLMYKEYFKGCFEHNIIKILMREKWEFTIKGNLI